MFGGNEIDVVAITHVLKFQVPFGELFRREVEAVALVSDVMILTKYLKLSELSLRLYV